MLTRSSRRPLSERIDNEGSSAKKRKVDRPSKTTTKKEKISDPHENKMNDNDSINIESCNPGPSTSRSNNSTFKNLDAIKENLPLHAIGSDTEETNPKENSVNIVNDKSRTKEETDLKENNANITNGKPRTREDESDTDDIVEIEVPRQVEEVVLSSDDEDENLNFETKENDIKILSAIEGSHPSGSSGSISQTKTTATPAQARTVSVKTEEPSPQSTLTPKSKKLVLDPSILTPPTGDLRKDSEKYYKCLMFLGQSELNPAAKEFVPMSKAVPKAADKKAECIVCLEPRETTFVNLPCRHAVTCGACSDQLELLGRNCPVCRTPIQSRFQIYN
ncbi:unnamed protein product [Meganyctiphanes norvegica]|uniref:RING-type domain-containing protein n=1 Tax=Meganyctiphanes norvegica TaxID=48144 RepID=A0AAV2RRR2_MEGNR